MDALKDRPPGLDATEVLVYRRGYARGCAKYLRDTGAPTAKGPRPTDPDEFRTWKADLYERTETYRSGVHAVAQPYALRALQAYWKLRGIEPKIAPSTRVRKTPVKQTVVAGATMIAPDDVTLLIQVALRAKMVGTASAMSEALSEVLDILGITKEGALVA